MGQKLRRSFLMDGWTAKRDEARKKKEKAKRRKAEKEDRELRCSVPPKTHLPPVGDVSSTFARGSPSAG